MISLQGTLVGGDRNGEVGDAAATAATASPTITTTIEARVIFRFYTFRRSRVPIVSPKLRSR
jgi:hypothetical protein